MMPGWIVLSLLTLGLPVPVDFVSAGGRGPGVIITDEMLGERGSVRVGVLPDEKLGERGSVRVGLLPDEKLGGRGSVRADFKGNMVNQPTKAPWADECIGIHRRRDNGSDGASPSWLAGDSGADGASPSLTAGNSGSDGASPSWLAGDSGADGASPSLTAGNSGSDGASPSWTVGDTGSEGAAPSWLAGEIGSDGASPSRTAGEIGSDGASPTPPKDSGQVTPEPRQTVTQGTLKASAERVINDFESGETRLEGNVQAEISTDPNLPPTRITTDRLIIRRADGIARAEGATRLIDDAGTVEANNLEIRFTPTEEGKPSVFLYATAQRPRLKLGKALISGETLRIEPGVWIIEQGQATLVDLARGGTRIRARRIRIYPGDYGVAEQAVFTIAGQPLPPVARLRFNLDRRVTGIKPPNLTNRRGVGFGISWDSFVAVGSQSAVGASWNSFPGLAPSYRLEYVYSTLDARRQPFSIAPRDDLDERVRDGWFNNVGVGTPEEEAESLRRDLSSASFGTMWNVATSARVPDSQDVSKAWQAGYDFGREAGGWGQRLTFKVHRIRPDDLTNWVDRGLVYASVSAPPVRLSRDWAVVSRADLFGTFSNRGQFGFARTELGLIGRPGGGLTLGAAYAYGYETGRPDFAFDRLVAPEAFLLRADYQRGPWTFRYLAKFDIRARSWYDREWELALVAGSFEPFMLRREFPTDYRIGIRFRIDDLVNRLQRRDFRRGEEGPKRIVGK